ncbi:hypothetical protein C1I98_36605 [Spongiactinospora gelatinilytica]|uniref:Uncharacterized protein n=1 Tax=Spongiactinospora gelatinilytica TaxID=2666298 RepID=A0A2W2FCS6_9ACTN|nr:hypothetical protein [Spongiactinospora gelatinilytica]PZG22588.1 hypothetical protein C1I98_36605 [Spongiactinospora gelatinilytica]
MEIGVREVSKTALTGAAIEILGFLNVILYRASKGYIILYRFRPQSCLTLNLACDDESAPNTVILPYVKERGDYVVLGDLRIEEAGFSPSRILDASQIEVEVDGSLFEAERVGLGGPRERSELLARVRKQVSWTDRHEIDERGQFPIARLRKL